jgi:hypothetical protein
MTQSMILISVALFVWQGTITVYLQDGHAGNPLYCDQRWSPGSANILTYDPATPQWIALDESAYRSGRAQCGDIIQVAPRDGSPAFFARALDAGRLAGHEVLTFPGNEIVGDIPEIYWPYRLADGTVTQLCFLARLTNYSAFQRRIADLRREHWM